LGFLVHGTPRFQRRQALTLVPGRAGRIHQTVEEAGAPVAGRAASRRIGRMSATPTLVLLPGLACDARLWQAQMPVLPAALSPRVSDAHSRHARIEDMAAAVLHETTGPLVLCGASMGGMIAMEVSRQAPERVLGLALLGTNAQPESPETYKLRADAIE